MVRSSADQVASCLHHRQWLEVQARSKHPLSLLHTKLVFVTGYALCLFLTSCDFPRLRTRSPPVCLSEAEAEAEAAPACLPVAADEAAPPCVFPWPRTRPRAPAPAHMQSGGRFPGPRTTRQTGVTSQHAGHAALDLRALQGHLAQAHVVQGLNALLPRVDVGLVQVTRRHRVRVEQRER